MEEAVELSNKALALAPDDELISNTNKNFNNDLQNLKRTISEWNKLDFYKRKILHIIQNSPRRPSNSYIAKELGHNVQLRAIGGHLQRLIEKGWIIEEKPNYVLNKFVSKILPLCDNQFLVGGNNSSQILTGEQNNQGSVVPIKTSIVRLEDRQAIKPIFNSNGEFHWYQEFVSFFPNYYVMPNTSLQTIFKYETMKTLLNPDDFNYYLMASVDICVISTEDFLPKFGFELDSHFHDEEKQKIRDERKNRIFLTANLPLIRVRRDGVISRDDIRNNIREALDSMPNIFQFSTVKNVNQTSSNIQVDDNGDAVF